MNKKEEDNLDLEESLDKVISILQKQDPEANKIVEQNIDLFKKKTN